MTVTDTLETLITLRGTESVISNFTEMATQLIKAAEGGEALEAAAKGLEIAQAALLEPLTAILAETTLLTTALFQAVAGFTATAAAEGVMAAATGVLDAALAVLASPLVLIGGLLAALTGAAFPAVEGLNAFSKSEASLARTALQLKNLKGSIPIGELVEFSDHLSELTGINHNVIATLGATAAQFGETKTQIEKLLPTVLDISQAKGLDPDQVLNKLLRAGTRPQGLIALGIDPKKLTGDLHDVDNLINQVGRGFTGVAAGFRDTLPGTTEALKDSMERLFEALGRFISPVVLPLLNLMISGIDKLTAVLDRLATFFHLPTAANLGAGGPTADIGFKGDPEQTAALKGIQQNTKAASDALVKDVLGGSGAVARGAFTMRDAKLAFGI